MSTVLKKSKLQLKGIMPGKTDAFPALRNPIKSTIAASLDEDDGLFLHYGIMDHTLPYAMQDDYDTEKERMLTFDTFVLENDYIRAEIIPSLGGRLWSIYDKEHKRDLVLPNTELKICNLAVRNAWFAGGVEFNIGRRGHDEQTCSNRFAATLTADDGTPVLRIYEMDRDRHTPFQLDFYLPENSRFLKIRGRITNPNDHVEPMYWWSNIAANEEPGSRIVVPADNAYSNFYVGGSHCLTKVELPFGEGFDATNPKNYPAVKDHFYNIPEGVRPYECVFSQDGTGLAYVSTKRLRGRKLFVWGSCQGGRHWQKKLLGEAAYPAYIEIQGGIGRTQQECIPMPPYASWEWIEAYGYIAVDKEKVFGDWDEAVKTVSAEVERLLPAAELEEELKTTRRTIAMKKGEVQVAGSGYGALEELRRGAKLAPQLDFGTPSAEQNDWLDLLAKGEMNDLPPTSYMVRDEWFDALKKAKESWKTCYHLALCYFCRKDTERALHFIDRSIELQKNAWNTHAKGHLLLILNNDLQGAEYLLEAALMMPGDGPMVKDSLKAMAEAKRYDLMFTLLEKLSADMRKRPMIQVLEATALVRTGKPAEAEAVLFDAARDEIRDIREGETSLSVLYCEIVREKARLAGEPVPEEIEVPFMLDLQMNTK
ncbi:MAG: DUF5107 domain-containing protein [Lentisphaeria bacterium]|nr:DUF5107 domain-containing protein [Lentisphaeria bacterium]